MSIIFLVIPITVFVWYFWEKNRRKTFAMPGGVHEDITLPHDQEWELYHNNFSLCSKKMRVCLAELGVPYRAHHIDLIETGSYENISRHFLAVNAASLVPVLVHHGHPIYESHEQLVYAASHSSDPGSLVPGDTVLRELMATWVHKTSLVGDNPITGMKETLGNAIPGLTLPIFATMIEAIPVHRIIEGLLFHRFKQRAVMFLMLKFRGPENLHKLVPIAKVIRRSRAAMHTHFDDLELVLTEHEGPWITGEQFTLADVGMMVIFDRLQEADWVDEYLCGQRPGVQAYWEALQSRESFRSALQNFSHATVDRGTARIKELKAHHEPFRDLLVDAST